MNNASRGLRSRASKPGFLRRRRGSEARLPEQKPGFKTTCEDDTMSRYRRVGRWALVAGAVLVAGWALLRVGVGIYLRTDAGRAAVAEQLQKAIGLPVEVTEMDVGSRSSSIKFRVLEPSTGTSPRAEVLSVESATADVSFADLITRSVAPKQL